MQVQPLDNAAVPLDARVSAADAALAVMNALILAAQSEAAYSRAVERRDQDAETELHDQFKNHMRAAHYASETARVHARKVAQYISSN